jgi:hypothetical protein
LGEAIRQRARRVGGVKREGEAAGEGCHVSTLGYGTRGLARDLLTK